MVGCNSSLPQPDFEKPLLELPKHFPPIEYTIAINPVTDAGFNLGRKLFYDPILSRDSTISCGSCHQQKAGFAHLNQTTSQGIDGQMGLRNAPILTNLLWKKAFMHDGGINHFDIQPFGPISNPIEMNQDLNQLISKLNNNTSYKTQFKAAFGTDSIFSQRIFRALVQFMACMITANTPYDKFAQGDSSALTALQQKGLKIFLQKCNGCHTKPLFHDNGFHQILPEQTDLGRYAITGNQADKFKFATPSLRNIAHSAPYFHNGTAKSLLAVLTQKTKTPSNIELSDTEQKALLAFLEGLSDNDFLTNPIFSEP